jgi:hypothetical protein
MPQSELELLQPQEILRRMRQGQVPAADEIRALVAGIADGRLGDAQVGAFAMAVCTRGLPPEATTTLTLAMRDSGTVLDWRGAGFDAPVLDKHSTGGIGDVVSLMLGPMLAACGALVPMLSGRGLGHTGGTLDKLEAIPGYCGVVDVATTHRCLREAGVAIIGAGPDLAPADRRLYAIRDITGTVESLPLITASILSKKLAANSNALILDVKTGSGAFMATAEAARELAQQQRFGLTAESLLFEWSKRSNQEKTHPTSAPRVHPCTRGSLRCSRLAGRCATRTSLCSNMLAFPCKSLRSSALHRGPHFPSTRLPAWSSRRASDSMCSARVESEAIEAQPSRSCWPAGPA